MIHNNTSTYTETFMRMYDDDESQVIEELFYAFILEKHPGERKKLMQEHNQLADKLNKQFGRKIYNHVK